MSTHISRVFTLLLLAGALAGLSVNPLFAQDPHRAVDIRQTIDKKCEAFLQEMLCEEHFTGVALVMKSNEVVHAKG